MKTRNLIIGSIFSWACTRVKQGNKIFQPIGLFSVRLLVSRTACPELVLRSILFKRNAFVAAIN
jgi:hypothetical protein